MWLDGRPLAAAKAGGTRLLFALLHEAASKDDAAGGERALPSRGDDPVARLRNLGYEVLEAGDGPQALQVLGEQERVDLVFIDLIMPGGISGLDLCDMVREKWPHVRPLLTSGYAEELTSSGHLERNQVQLLRKPYRQAELARAIENTLNPQ